LAFGEEHELREGEESLGVQRAEAKCGEYGTFFFPISLQNYRLGEAAILCIKV